MLPPPEGPLRIVAIFFFAAILRVGVKYLWDKSKARRTVVPMKLRKGVHVPWGFHERFIWHAGTVAFFWFGFFVCFAIYLSLTEHR